jgi:hypothetical protein
MSIEK